MWSAALVAAFLLGVGGAAHAVPLVVTWDDADDTTDTLASGNLLSMTLAFDNSTGDYTITLTASLDTSNADDPSQFFDNGNAFFLSTPTTLLELTGNDSELMGWVAGDRVAHCNQVTRCNHSLSIGGIFGSGINNDALVTTLGFATVTVVPEPTTALLLAVGPLGIGRARRW